MTKDELKAVLAEARRVLQEQQRKVQFACDDAGELGEDADDNVVPALIDADDALSKAIRNLG